MLGAWREDWIESHQISCNDTGFEVLETYDDGCLSRLHSLDWHHARMPLQDFVVESRYSATLCFSLTTSFPPTLGGNSGSPVDVGRDFHDLRGFREVSS